MAHGRDTGDEGEAAPVFAGALRRAGCLVAVGTAAKLVLVGLRAADGALAGLVTPWAPALLLYQEVWAALALLAVDGAVALGGRGLRRPVLADRIGWGLYAAAALYVAANVPIARQFATPLTYAFLEAAGGALRDSIAEYATAGNVLGFIAVLVIAGIGPRVIRRARRWWSVVAGIVLVLGPVGARRSETLGLHRGALVTLASTTWARWFPTAGPTVATDLPAEGPALELSHLRGAARGYNVIWVILESTGARHLPAYGAAVDATPNASRLAQRGLVFERMYTSYPESIKSLLPIFCSQYPAVHTAAGDYAAGRVGCVPLAGVLRDEGYRTGLFHSGRFRYLGMAAMVAERGFAVLADAAEIGGPHAVSFGTDDRATAERVLQFIDAGSGPFMAMYMPIAGHHPYRSPGPGTRPFAATTEAEHHRNDLHKGDEALGELIAGVAARGLMDRTVWLVMGDHGEAFFEHPGNFAHSLYVFEENVHIPVIVGLPGAVAGTLRVPQVGGTIDLGPTLLDLLGVTAPMEWAGRSLLRGEPGVARFFTDHSSVLLGLRQDRWKCIVESEAGKVRLYDLHEDPGETIDRSADEPARAERYRVHLTGWSMEQAGRVHR